MIDDKNYYLLQIIEMGEESKKKITINTSLTNEYDNDLDLGKEVRRLINQKISDCNDQINHAKNLLK